MSPSANTVSTIPTSYTVSSVSSGILNSIVGSYTYAPWLLGIGLVVVLLFFRDSGK